jgi:hypothetical protein
MPITRPGWRAREAAAKTRRSKFDVPAEVRERRYALLAATQAKQELEALRARIAEREAREAAVRAAKEREAAERKELKDAERRALEAAERAAALATERAIESTVIRS